MSVIRSFATYNNSHFLPNAKKCLALCHGHYHSTDKISRIRGNCYWYMIDWNPACGPDYVCDVSDSAAMAYIPDQSFDVIMTVHFPGGIRPEKYTAMLNIIRRLLKPDGKIYLAEANGVFNWFSSQDEKLALEPDIIGIIQESNWNTFLATVNSDKLEAIKRMLSRQYKGPYQPELNSYIDNIELEFAKKYLQTLNYEVTQYRKFLVLQLI